MEQILFLDACMRGPELSRTYRLCQHFLTQYATHWPETEVRSRNLCLSSLPLMTGALALERDTWVTCGLENPLLAPAREMAAADLILVGAPYWDLSFPAALKVYLEWASVSGITFRYEEDGRPRGLCRARALAYITTAGGPLAGQNYGYDYVRALAALFGIRKTYCVAAENLDIWGTDSEEALVRAEAELDALAHQLRKSS